jgi:hypothetical protein
MAMSTSQRCTALTTISTINGGEKTNENHQHADLSGAAAIALAPVAHADDAMYRVGVDIAPDDYRYTVVGNGYDAWQLCADARCEVGGGLIDMDTVDGMGVTGYLSITPDVKYVKLNDLILTPL